MRQCPLKRMCCCCSSRQKKGKKRRWMFHSSAPHSLLPRTSLWFSTCKKVLLTAAASRWESSLLSIIVNSSQRVWSIQFTFLSIPCSLIAIEINASATCSSSCTTQFPSKKGFGNLVAINPRVAEPNFHWKKGSATC